MNVDCSLGQFFSASRPQKVSKNFPSKKLTDAESLIEVDSPIRVDFKI